MLMQYDKLNSHLKSQEDYDEKSYKISLLTLDIKNWHENIELSSITTRNVHSLHASITLSISASSNEDDNDT